MWNLYLYYRSYIFQSCHFQSRIFRSFIFHPAFLVLHFSVCIFRSRVFQYSFWSLKLDIIGPLFSGPAFSALPEILPEIQFSKCTIQKKKRKQNYCKYAQNLSVYVRILGHECQGRQLRAAPYYVTFSVNVKIYLNFRMLKQFSNFSCLFLHQFLTNYNNEASNCVLQAMIRWKMLQPQLKVFEIKCKIHIL